MRPLHACVPVFLSAAFVFLSPGCGKPGGEHQQAASSPDSLAAPAVSAGGTSIRDTTVYRSVPWPVSTAVDSTGRPASDPVWIAVVREDGVLYPFAMYDYGVWSNPWPSQDMEPRMDSPDTTITTFAGVPKEWYAPLPEIPHDWHILSPAGYRGLMTVTRPAVVNEHCSGHWALVVKLLPHMTSSSQGVREFPAIALNVKQTAAIIDSIPADSGMGKRLLSLITPVCDSLEVVKRLPVPAAKRKSTPIRLLGVHRVRNASGGGSVLYFEARKDYDTKIEDGLMTNEGSSFFRFWAAEDEKGMPRLIDTGAFILGWKPDSIGKPVGALILDGRTFWFMTSSGWEGVVFEVYEAGPAGARLVHEVYGGGC